MRILVDLTQDQIRALDDLARRREQSRAALIRGAVDDLLDRQHNAQAVDAFGLWGDRAIDGLSYQEKVRGEW